LRIRRFVIQVVQLFCSIWYPLPNLGVEPRDRLAEYRRNL
jgi:hypothetical protein